MKTNILNLFIPILLLISCSGNSNQPVSKSQITQGMPLNENKEEFVKVYSLKNNDSALIGDVYVNYINDSIFTDLYILNLEDTLYSIKRNILFNNKGIINQVFNDGFYGYLFILKKNDYFVLSYLRNYGERVSDDITIEWNYKKSLMELQELP